MVNILSKLINFASKQSNADAKMPPAIKYKKPLGTEGTDVYAGYFAEEYLQKIRHLRGIDLYDEMRRSDSQIAMLLSTVKNPIKSATWSVESVDDSDEEQEIRDFIYHCLFTDIGNPKTGKRKSFKEFLEEALTFIEFGYSLFELVHKNVSGHPQFGDYIGLRDIGYRSQKTIESWKLRRDGSIQSVRQIANGDLNANANIPGDALLIMSLNKEGANYEGISMIRPCYGNWFRKNNYLKFMAIGIEKTAVGVPSAVMSEEFLKRDDYEDQFESLQDIMEQFATHESQSLVLPPGVTLGEVKINFDADKVQKAIDSEDVKMSKRFLANFMELGLSGGGSYSLGSDLSDIFLSGIQYIADMVCDQVNSCIVETLVKAKYGARETYPRLVCRGINDKAGKELADIITGFIQSGVIKPSERIEDFIHDRYKLPDVKRDQDDDSVETPDVNDNEQKEETELSESQIWGNGRSDDDPVIQEFPVGDSFDFEALKLKAFNEALSDMPSKAIESIKRGLNVQKQWDRDGIDVSLSEAALKGELTLDSVASIARYSRNQYQYRPELKEDDGGVTTGTIAYLLAGGDEGINWAKAVVEKTEKLFYEYILKEPKIANQRASVFVDRNAKQLQIEMKERQIERSDLMIDDVSRIIKGKGTNTQKSAKVMDTSLPQARAYAKFLQSYIGDVSQKTVAATLEEVGKSDLALSDEDFKNLPRKTKSRLKREIDLVAMYQDADLEKIVYFAINDELDKNTPPDEIIKQVKKNRDRYIESGTMFTAATNLISKSVNSVRNDVYQSPDVFDDIESFVFVNHDPKSAICKNLNGRVFTKEEYNTSPYLPPLHHNCKSVLQAQTKGKKGNKPIDPKGLMLTGTDEEIDKILKSKTI